METVQQLQEQVKELRSIVSDLRSESEQYRAETRRTPPGTAFRCRRSRAANKPSDVQVGADCGRFKLIRTTSQTPNAVLSRLPESRLAKIEEQYDLLTGKIDDQYQTKVESRSKYKVRLSGLVLMDFSRTAAGVLNTDVPGPVDDD